MIGVESAVVERPLPGKGHDRAFADDAHNIYGVWDGADNKRASQMAMTSLRRHVRTSDNFDVVAAMGESQANLLQRQETLSHLRVLNLLRGPHYTTGLLLHLAVVDDQLVSNYANAGDSRLYRYDHDQAELCRVTRDESVDNFLGTRQHVLSQVGRSAVLAPTTFMLATDGIVSKHFADHALDKKITTILAQNNSPAEAAHSLMENTPAFDDTTIIVVKALPYAA